MARKKKKKVLPKVPLPTEVPIKSQDESKKSESLSGRPSHQVSLLTCTAGMILSLVLGIYLGTLFPELTAKISNQNDVAENQSSYANLPSNVEKENINRVAPAEEAKPVNKLAERIAMLEKEAVHNPANATTWTELGNLYFDTNQPKLAINAYERSLAISPNNPDVLTDLGIMYRENENFSKAVESFRKASSINPNHENALFNEGIVLSTDLHNNKEALEAWTKLLRINPAAHGPDGMPVSEMIKKLR